MDDMGQMWGSTNDRIVMRGVAASSLKVKRIYFLLLMK